MFGIPFFIKKFHADCTFWRKTEAQVELGNPSYPYQPQHCVQSTRTWAPGATDVAPRETSSAVGKGIALLLELPAAFRPLGWEVWSFWTQSTKTISSCVLAPSAPWFLAFPSFWNSSVSLWCRISRRRAWTGMAGLRSHLLHTYKVGVYLGFICFPLFLWLAR